MLYCILKIHPVGDHKGKSWKDENRFSRLSRYSGVQEAGGEEGTEGQAREVKGSKRWRKRAEGKGSKRSGGPPV